jgi:antitoxin FitA
MHLEKKKPTNLLVRTLNSNEANHDRKMEQKTRSIWHERLKESAPVGGMVEHMHARFAAIGGIELELHSRTGAPKFATFD